MEKVAQVGGYVLEPGPAGTAISAAGDGDGTEDGARRLQRAFAEPAPPKQPDPALATEVEGASQATAKIERAVALAKGIGEGKALDPTQLALEVGALLDCLERLDRKKEHKKAIQMARALATLLMLLKRWTDLLRTLRTALRAGEQLGDLDAVAWAEHELGTLRLAAGEVAEAERSLGRAKEIRERIGDRRGLAATERNMGVLCQRLREMIRSKDLVRPSSRGLWSAPSRLLALAGILAALLFGSGVAAGMIADNGPGSKNVAAGTDDPSGSPGPGDGDGDGNGTGDGDGTNGQPGDGDGSSPASERIPEVESFPLTIAVAGDGDGEVEIEGYECDEPPCEVAAGETLTIVAYASRGSIFEGFSGSCSGTENPCTVTATAPISVTATFRDYVTDGATYSRGEPTGDESEGEVEEEASAEALEEPPLEEVAPPPEEEGE